MKRAAEVPLKKPYQAPKLIVYGDLAQLTMGRAKIGGMLDGVMTKRT
jgi:hypothetical protein